MDEHLLLEEGYYNIFGSAGARTEMPGCSLCMGNQARVAPNSTVLSTSTRNFPNRLGDGANVYLTSAELASVGAILGRLPTPQEYLEFTSDLDSMSDEIYRYMNFDQIVEFQKSAEEGKRIAAVEIQELSV
jgi:aconitate hydratase 2/2-methylisocitrate dehydratase